MRAIQQARQGGAVLVTALFLMLAVLMIGVSAARSALNAEKSARHERDRHVAFASAEAALVDAERDIEGGADPASARAALVTGAGFVDGCGDGGAGANLGLCLPATAAAPPVWQVLDLAEGNAVPYGRYSGAAMPVAGGMLPARLPRYIVELVALAPPSAGTFYRITAVGFGSRPTTRVVLQSYYRKPAPATPSPPGAPAPGAPGAEPPVPPLPADAPGSPGPPGAPPPGPESPDGAPPASPTPDVPPGGAPSTPAVPAGPPQPPPAGRISWREIANWPDLHAEAIN